MLEITKNNAETTDNIHYDVLSDVLSSLRVSGSILLNEDYASPWAIAIPNAERLRTALQAQTGAHVITLSNADISKSRPIMGSRQSSKREKWQSALAALPTGFRKARM